MRSLRNLRGGPCPQCGTELQPNATGQCAACGWSERSVVAPSVHKRPVGSLGKTPLQLKILGGLQVAWGAWIVLASLVLLALGRRFFALITDPPGPDKSISLWFSWLIPLAPVLLVLLIISLVLGLLNVGCGVGLIRGRRWAVVMAAIIGWLMLVSSIASIVSSGFNGATLVTLVLSGAFITALYTAPHRNSPKCKTLASR